MNRFESVTKPLMWFMALLLAALAAGCGGGQGPILGSGGGAALAPTVTAVAPLANATGVPINTKIVTAAFSKAMNPATLTITSFTLACGAAGTAGVVGTPLTPVTGGGAVTYLPAGNVATLPLPAATNLPATADCTATVTTAAKDTTGVPLAANFVWIFTTGVTPDIIKPRVLSTFPANLAAAVPTNTAITAIFNEDMDPATISSLSPTLFSFTLTCAAGTTPGACVNPSRTGNVSYAVGSRTATFTPGALVAGVFTSANLEAGKTYTATINGTTLPVVKDLAGNVLAGGLVGAPNPTIAADYVWTFATAAAPAPPGNISVLSTHTACPNAVNATFTVPSGLRMDPASVVAGSTFTVTGPAPGVAVVNGTVALDAATGTIATFTPTAALTVGSTYTLTITGGAAGVKDLAVTPNTLNMAADTRTFVPAAATGACTAPAPLGVAAPFGSVVGVTGATNTGIDTVINGDFSSTATTTSTITGFHDSALPVPDIYTETGANIGLVTGLMYTCTVSTTGPTSAAVNAASCTTAGNALLAAQATYDALVAKPDGGVPIAANLAGLTVPPGVYTAPAGSFLIQDGLPGPAGDLTLDAQGNANAVWVFKMASTLTVGGPGAAFPRSINLINGAQAKNVFWQVGSSATINAGGGGTMQGNIYAAVKVTVSTVGVATPVILNGRAVGLTAQTVLNNTIINVPAP